MNVWSVVAVAFAAAQGRFRAFDDPLFEGQDSLGVVPWSRYARAAGIQGTRRFDARVRATSPVPVIERDISAAKAAGAIGTPTVLIDGSRYTRVPTRMELDRWVDSARSTEP